MAPGFISQPGSIPLGTSRVSPVRGFSHSVVWMAGASATCWFLFWFGFDTHCSSPLYRQRPTLRLVLSGARRSRAMCHDDSTALKCLEVQSFHEDRQERPQHDASISWQAIWCDQSRSTTEERSVWGRKFFLCVLGTKTQSLNHKSLSKQNTKHGFLSGC